MPRITDPPSPVPRTTSPARYSATSRAWNSLPCTIGRHEVPYRTAALAVQDLVAGRVQFTIDSPMMLAPLVREGRLRGLAVSGTERSEIMPGLPTIAESGVAGYELTAWQALFVRPGTPPDAQAALTDAARRAVADPGVRARLLLNASEVWPDSSPEAAAAHVREQVARWAPMVAQMGLAN